MLALGVMIVLTIAGTATITSAFSNSQDTTRDTNRLQAAQLAEAGMAGAYGMINYQNSAGSNPSAANLLGCPGANGATDPNGPSNCTTVSAKLLCVSAPFPCAAGASGTAAFYGYYSGSAAGSYAGVSVPVDTWLIYSTGYARDSVSNTIVSQTKTAMVTISALNSGAVASVWNHIFITAPRTNDTCQLDFSGNGIIVNDPLYVSGNFCLSGPNVAVQETSAGQPVDLQVGGKLVLSGSGSKVGTDASHPITSGVVIGGCTTGSVTSAAVPCSPAGLSYWVGKTDTFVPNDAPVVTQADMATDYANFDPGPKHPCAAGTTPLFDNDTASNLSTEPNNSAGSFELTPASSYSCISQSGATTGELSWNNSTKQLKISGSIFSDGSMTVSQSATYTGTAVIELAGTFTVNGNGTALCATGPPCDFTNWQGASSNKSMLTIAALATNTTGIIFSNNAQTFQGSVWTQPSSAMTFVKNGVTVGGPISVGRFDATFNNASFKALPVIKNMPIGAPVPPNTGLTIGPLTYR